MSSTKVIRRPGAAARAAAVKVSSPVKPVIKKSLGSSAVKPAIKKTAGNSASKPPSLRPSGRITSPASKSPFDRKVPSSARASSVPFGSDQRGPRGSYSRDTARSTSNDRDLPPRPVRKTDLKPAPPLAAEAKAKIRPFFVTTAKGMEETLAEELNEIGIPNVRLDKGGVGFEATLESAYRVCLWSRVAVRVLLPVHEFEASTPEKLYGGVKSIRWSDHLLPDRTLAIDFVSHHSAIEHTQFGAQKVKDAIVDQLRSIHGERPSVDLFSPDVRINVYLKDDIARVSIDLSGESLHKRGYRTDGAAAPLKENLAAACLRIAGWPAIAAKGGFLVDPMCGSGTFLIEAAEMLIDRAPGLRRQKFGFTRWLGHDAEAWDRLRKEAKERGKTAENLAAARAGKVRFWGYDASPSALKAAQENLNAAGLSELTQISRKDFREVTTPPEAVPGLVIVNPPYGERLGEVEELKPLYRSLGDLFKKQFLGWQAAVLTGNMELSKSVGLKASRRTVLYNGAIECRLLKFELY